MLTPAAIPGRVAVLDVGVTSPAAAFGEDATKAMYRRKVQEREGERPELEAQNIEYRPLVWTCFGRPHQAATDALKLLEKSDLEGVYQDCKDFNMKNEQTEEIHTLLFETPHQEFLQKQLRAVELCVAVSKGQHLVLQQQAAVCIRSSDLGIGP